MSLWTAAKFIVILKFVTSSGYKNRDDDDASVNHGPKKRSTKQRIKMLNNERILII